MEQELQLARQEQLQLQYHAARVVQKVRMSNRAHWKQGLAPCALQSAVRPSHRKEAEAGQRGQQCQQRRQREPPGQRKERHWH